LPGLDEVEGIDVAMRIHRRFPAPVVVLRLRPAGIAGATL